jgi:hypothetical protein
MNQYQKDFDMFLKIVVYGLAAMLFLDLLKVLPNDLSDKIVNLLLEKIGL